MFASTLFLAMAAAQAQPASRCADVVTVEATVCRALEAEGKGEFGQAAQAFERAAETKRMTSAVAGDPEVARLLAAAGNMWIAADDPARAGKALDQALAGGGLSGEQRGEALLDRARAAEAQNDLKTARARLNEAAASISEDPFYWYFSAALAIREEDKVTAQRAIGKALTLAPGDPTVLFEAGHVAHFAGDVEAARGYWTRAAAADPKGASGQAARQALALLPAVVTYKDGGAKAR